MQDTTGIEMSQKTALTALDAAIRFLRQRQVETEECIKALELMRKQIAADPRGGATDD